MNNNENYKHLSEAHPAYYFTIVIGIEMVFALLIQKQLIIIIYDHGTTKHYNCALVARVPCICNVTNIVLFCILETATMTKSTAEIFFTPANKAANKGNDK